MMPLEEIVWAELHGGLWHTTCQERFYSILRDGEISPEPKNIPDNERYGNALVENGYPYVRTLGGVSLFDFDQFSPESYDQKYPINSLREFFPYKKIWGNSVWIEIDPKKIVPSRLISGSDLLARWKYTNAYNRIMAGIEAAYLEPLPRRAFKRVFLVSGEDSQIQNIPF